MTRQRSFVLGNSDDLLIGGQGKNVLKSGAGNDFLFGGSGDDLLVGGEGIDTAVYFGKQSDYDITRNSFFGFPDGSFSIYHARNRNDEVNPLNDAGTDRLEGIEYVQFGDGTSYSKFSLNDLALSSDSSLTPNIAGNINSSSII